MVEFIETNAKDMVDLFAEEDLKVLSEMEGEACVSIYIPAHQEGVEVNENMDKISFKNEVQRVRQVLEGQGFQKRYIDNLLSPALDLAGNTGFWKDQSAGFAAFIKEGFFRYYRVPLPFKNFSNVSSRFLISPLIPVLELNRKFFILTLNQYDFRLFECTWASIKEVEIEDAVRERIDESLVPFEYRNDMYEPMTENRRKSTLARTKEKGDTNTPEFFRQVNELVIQKLKGEEAPLVVAGIEEWQGDFRKINKYKNLWEKGYTHNAQFLSSRELHEKVRTLMQPYFDRPRQNALMRYSALAGSGKTSDDINTVLSDAAAGRVESLFIPANEYIWGNFDAQNNKLTFSEAPVRDNYSLLDYAAQLVSGNSGQVYVLDKNEMPGNARIAAVYRY